MISRTRRCRFHERPVPLPPAAEGMKKLWNKVWVPAALAFPLVTILAAIYVNLTYEAAIFWLGVGVTILVYETWVRKP
jgi:hypothetical protein